MQLFDWYKSSQRIKYPSTLYVTVKSIIPLSRVEPSTRSMFATQEVHFTLSYTSSKVDYPQRFRDGNRKADD